jgi:hypothetical protein
MLIISNTLNVIYLEARYTRKQDIKSALLYLFRSTTSYDNTITLALVYTILDTFLFLVLDRGSYSPRYSSLFRLPFRYLRFRFFDEFEDFLRIKDELSFNRYALPFLTFFTYS